MDFELSEEQRAFAQTARDFALAEFAPVSRKLLQGNSDIR